MPTASQVDTEEAQLETMEDFPGTVKAGVWEALRGRRALSNSLFYVDSCSFLRSGKKTLPAVQRETSEYFYSLELVTDTNASGSKQWFL